MAKQPAEKPERSDQEVRESALAGELKQAQADLAAARKDLEAAQKDAAAARKTAAAAERELQEHRDRLLRTTRTVLVTTRDCMIGDVPTQLGKEVATVDQFDGVTLDWITKALNNGTVRPKA